MKALKNGSTIYTVNIVSAISNCYAKSAEPSNAELLELYGNIGRCICEQGEKAFVGHLAQALAEQFPQIKGFSPRNLRRMRDFYNTYENQPELMCKAQALGWTQNATILDCCETDEQRAFYIALATEKNLSKLALMKTIEADVFAAALTDETETTAVTTVCPTVGDCAAQQGVDTITTTKQLCGAFVTACEPPRQGSGLPIERNKIILAVVGKHNTDDFVWEQRIYIKHFSRQPNTDRVNPNGWKAPPQYLPDVRRRMQAA